MNNFDLIALGMSRERFEKINKIVMEHICMEDPSIFIGCLHAISHTSRNKGKVDIDLFLKAIKIAESIFKYNKDIETYKKMMIEEVIFEVFGEDLSLLPYYNS